MLKVGQFASILAILSIVGCEPQEDQRLIGEWRMNRGMTLNNIDPSMVDKDVLDFLRNHEIDAVIVYEENRYAVIIDGDDSAMEFLNYRVISKDEFSVTIDNDYDIEARFVYQGDCYINTGGWYGYDEYWCRI
ncbi:hypothetical protein HBA55_36420 [Pseudomaricurvus alkylphenolicus]|uniref:hypothetical protein n=1 Tax=Pseudomaricurvus alkylphenolicus TaxID=1306991 RepID=UPI001422BB3B|nr:hypothetical protein [Pseudomaricurvus alkylphenolicus]NIB45121.1 hypothetical protein [Pseudomaricurvus alkylphenolicus]